MPISKERLSDIKEKYEKAEKLVEEDSKLDTPSDPFQSHYAARDILIHLQIFLKDALNHFEFRRSQQDTGSEESSVGSGGIDTTSDESTENEENAKIYRFILGFIYKDTGKIYVWTEELASGEKHLMHCIDLLENYKLNPGCVNAYMGALNQLGILWSVREDPNKSKEFLLRALDTYTEFKKSNNKPLTIYDLFGTADEIEDGKGLDIFEKTHTLTLFYLAQILGQLGDLHQSAIYCHETLKRQLELNNYEPIDWALNAATLSQYFCTNNRKTISRHHLAAASYILEKYETEMYKPDMSEEQKAAVLEQFNHRSADVYRCWAKYGLNLLAESRDRLMNDSPNEEPSVQSAELYRFYNIDAESYENAITDEDCLMFDDAKPVFLMVQNWLNKAKEYYRADTEASEYARIIQDLASSYKYLAFFDFDENNQCKLHKRRADLIEDLLNLLNPTYYMSICRELMYELGITYSNILDIKLDIFERMNIRDTPDPHVLNKINTLCKKSIAKFTDFIDTYKDKQTDLLTTVNDEEMAPIMFAFFQIGRLYYKIITPDKHMQILNNQNSLKYYGLFVKYCDERKTIGDSMKAEYSVCKEMISLLPLKILKLRE